MTDTNNDADDAVLWTGECRTLDAFGLFEAHAEVQLDMTGRYVPVVLIYRGGMSWCRLSCSPLDEEGKAIKRAQWLVDALRPDVRPEDPVYDD